MRTSTMLGIGPTSGEYDDAEAEPVYLLTRKRVSTYPPPPDESEYDDPVPSRDAVRSTFRRRSIRFLGVVGLAVATTGVVRVLERPEGRREVLSWVTMGHPDQAARAGKRLEAAIAWLRGM
jgi:hypothetical protein